MWNHLDPDFWPGLPGAPLGLIWPLWFHKLSQIGLWEVWAAGWPDFGAWGLEGWIWPDPAPVVPQVVPNWALGVAWAAAWPNPGAGLWLGLLWCLYLCPGGWLGGLARWLSGDSADCMAGWLASWRKALAGAVALSCTLNSLPWWVAGWPGWRYIRNAM